ncbi:OLC1v1020150C1 [Oldenlandia corymbosa var. corymbosa]|uniref:OLC1v1020150C1 n=1 Tax=Oldenlandia corymbosa var. corymbosa TaxID=529605 RepID=A0AAV1EFT5_OLDCO|nr:OLC1v1020150C1 [Oldenlandia corymbosa var. corymbosa]
MSFLAQRKRKYDLILPSMSLSILKKQYESKQIFVEQSIITKQSRISSHEISVIDLIKMAKETMSVAISQNSDNFIYHNSFVWPSITSKDLQLVIVLQAAAINFSRQQFHQARNLLNICQRHASHDGNTLQRLLYYYTEALQEGIVGEIGGEILHKTPNGCQKYPALRESIRTVQAAVLECNQKMPFCPVTQFTAVQAILDNVASSRRVHLVDLEIRSGSQWPMLMQALASRRDCPLEFLKITAVGSSKEMIEETGNKLSSFAKSLNIPFAFKTVVTDLKNLDIEFFELEPDEALAVYSELRLASLLAWPHHLESLIETIKKMRPCVMVTIEIDSNTNTPNFLDRFNASLFVTAAMLDCLDVCMGRDSLSRAIVEGVLFRRGIHYLVTSKGEEDIHRQENVGFWRDLFEKCGMVELELSSWASYQATLVVESNPRWSSCTLERDGKGMTVGWKGATVHFLNVWKCDSFSDQ